MHHTMQPTSQRRKGLWSLGISTANRLRQQRIAQHGVLEGLVPPRPDLIKMDLLHQTLVADLQYTNTIDRVLCKGNSGNPEVA